MKILKFSAAWCAPCKAMKPVLKAFLAEHPEIEVVTHDLDDPESYELSEKLGVRAIPTLLWLPDAQTDKKAILARVAGLATKTQLDSAHRKATAALEAGIHPKVRKRKA